VRVRAEGRRRRRVRNEEEGQKGQLKRRTHLRELGILDREDSGSHSILQNTLFSVNERVVKGKGIWKECHHGHKRPSGRNRMDLIGGGRSSSEGGTQIKKRKNS
jgi:hypothetical protein